MMLSDRECQKLVPYFILFHFDQRNSSLTRQNDKMNCEIMAEHRETKVFFKPHINKKVEFNWYNLFLNIHNVWNLLLIRCMEIYQGILLYVNINHMYCFTIPDKFVGRFCLVWLVLSQNVLAITDLFSDKHLFRNINLFPFN